MVSGCPATLQISYCLLNPEPKRLRSIRSFDNGTSNQSFFLLDNQKRRPDNLYFPREMIKYTTFAECSFYLFNFILVSHINIFYSRDNMYFPREIIKYTTFAKCSFCLFNFILVSHINIFSSRVYT